MCTKAGSIASIFNAIYDVLKDIFRCGKKKSKIKITGADIKRDAVVHDKIESDVPVSIPESSHETEGSNITVKNTKIGQDFVGHDKIVYHITQTESETDSQKKKALGDVSKYLLELGEKVDSYIPDEHSQVSEAEISDAFLKFADQYDSIRDLIPPEICKDISIYVSNAKAQAAHCKHVLWLSKIKDPMTTQEREIASRYHDEFSKFLNNSADLKVRLGSILDSIKERRGI